MTRKITKSAAAERIHKLAMAARAVQRVKSGGCCGRKPSSKRKRRVFKRSSLNKEASRDFMRKMACAIAVIQRTRGLQKRAEDDTPIYKNPLFIGGAGGGLIGGTLGAILGPKGQKFLSGLAGAGIGTAAGVGAGYGYTKLKKPKEEKQEQAPQQPQSQVPYDVQVVQDYANNGVVPKSEPVSARNTTPQANSLVAMSEATNIPVEELKHMSPEEIEKRLNVADGSTFMYPGIPQEVQNDKGPAIDLNDNTANKVVIDKFRAMSKQERFAWLGQEYPDMTADQRRELAFDPDAFAKFFNESKPYKTKSDYSKEIYGSQYQG